MEKAIASLEKKSGLNVKNKESLNLGNVRKENNLKWKTWLQTNTENISKLLN